MSRNIVLVKIIMKGIEAFCNQLIVFNIRYNRLTKAIFNGRPPLTSYEQIYPIINKDIIQYLPILGGGQNEQSTERTNQDPTSTGDYTNNDEYAHDDYTYDIQSEVSTRKKIVVNMNRTDKWDNTYLSSNEINNTINLAFNQQFIVMLLAILRERYNRLSQ